MKHGDHLKSMSAKPVMKCDECGKMGHAASTHQKSTQMREKKFGKRAKR